MITDISRRKIKNMTTAAAADLGRRTRSKSFTAGLSIKAIKKPPKNGFITGKSNQTIKKKSIKKAG
jgi:hypothetical protein